MWKQLCLFTLAASTSLPASASPWYAEAAYAGGQTGNVAVGYQFRPWLGVEAGYRRSEDGNHIGWGLPRRIDDSDGVEVAVRTSIDVSPRFALTGRFGMYDWDGEDFAFNGSPMPIVVEREGLSPVLGAGMRVKLTEHFALTGEYTLSEAFESASGPDEMLSAGVRVSF